MFTMHVLINPYRHCRRDFPYYNEPRTIGQPLVWANAHVSYCVTGLDFGAGKYTDADGLR